MKAIITFLVTILVSIRVFATAQISDKIIYESKEYALHTNPLETYFDKHPDKRPKEGIISTALWRGYLATFEIKESQLFLKDIEIMVRSDKPDKTSDFEWKSVLAEVFPNEKQIKIDWLTGLLVLPYGELVDYVHMSYGLIYENYLLITIEKGNFVQEKKLDAKQYGQFRERQFLAFKQTDEYRKLKEELARKLKEELKEEFSDEFFESYIRGLVTVYTSRILID